MSEINILQFFVEFNPTPKQLKRLTRILKSIHKWWGIDRGESVIEATLLLAPTELSKLSPAAYFLLRRCQNRIWAFKVDFNREYDPFHKQTYRELFELLLSLGLIKEAALAQKIKGSKTVKELQTLLIEKGESKKGKKDELVSRIIRVYSSPEIEEMASEVILFRTTEAGDAAIETIKEMKRKMEQAFQNAVVGTMTHFQEKKEPAPEFPPGVYYDNGVVSITEYDVQQAKEEYEPSIDLVEETPKE